MNELRDTLAEIGRLEDEHGFLGVRFTLREYVDANRTQFTSRLTAEELAPHVLATLQQSVELSTKLQKGLITFAKPNDAQA